MELLLKNNNTPGHYFFKDRDSLRNILIYTKTPFAADTLFLSTRNKYALLVLMTKYGKSIIDKDHGEKILQKDLKKLTFPCDINYDQIDILFNMIHKIHNGENIQCGLNKKIIENKLFEIFEYTYYESLFDLRKITAPLSFAEHIFNLESFKNEDPYSLLNNVLLNPDTIFRNNVKLFYVRYQNILNFLKD